MSDIFLSYARHDQEVADMVVRAAQYEGWSVWYDKHIGPGFAFDQAIQRELDAAQVVIVLWSKASSASMWVNAEATAAANRGVLVSVLLKGGTIPPLFSRIQAIKLDSRAPDGGQSAVAELVRILAERIRGMPALEQVVSPKIIEAYLMEVCGPVPPAVIFNHKFEDVVDHFGALARCFHSLAREFGVEVEGGRLVDLPIHKAAKCIDTNHLSEFMVRFFAKHADWDYFECAGFSRHYFGKFRDADDNMIGYYVVGPVTLADVVRRHCKLARDSEGCPFSFSDRDMGLLETRLENLRYLVSEEYKTRVRRIQRRRRIIHAEPPVPSVAEVQQKIQHAYTSMIQRASEPGLQEDA